uniref:MFS domain-containing protein n=1 Tax=Caenorhabditis tropicalis TaxID=1561998 RepID=A0A1I7TRQ3_9PELO
MSDGKRNERKRTAMKSHDVELWVSHNQQQPQQNTNEREVRFEEGPRKPESSSSSEEEPLAESPVYLDGGYGWAVVFLSFLMHSIVDGSSFCTGLFYGDLRSEFKVDHAVAMRLASAFLSLPLLAAPFAGLFTDVYGCKNSILVGGLICTFFGFLSIFATEFNQMLWTLGVGCGIGMSLIYNAAVVIVTYYFDDNRGIATSLAVSGTGFGVFVYPFFLRIVKSSLELVASPIRATMIAYTFGYAVLVVIGAIIKDVEWKSNTIEFKQLQFLKLVEKVAEQEQFETPAANEGLRRANSLPNLSAPGHESGNQATSDDSKLDGPTRSKSVALLGKFTPRMPPIPEYSMLTDKLANLEHLDLELAHSPCTTIRAERHRVTSKISMSVDQINEMEDDDIKFSFLPSSSSSRDSEMSNDGDSSSSELSERKPEAPPKPTNSSAPNSARHRSSISTGIKNAAGGRVLASNTIPAKWTTNLTTMGKMTSAPMIYAHKKSKGWLHRLNLHNFAVFLEKLYENYKTVFKVRTFIYMNLSVFCLYATLDVPYVFFFDYAKENLSVSETFADWVYSAMGGATMVTTIAIGRVSDYVDKRKYFAISYAVSMCMAAFALFSAFEVSDGTQLILVAIWFGMFISANYVLQSIIIFKMFGDVEVFQSAYSMVGLVEGIASLVGPLLFGFIRDQTSFGFCFIISGVCLLLSGFFALLMYKEWWNEEDDEEESDSVEGALELTDLSSGKNSKQIAEANGFERESLLHESV